MMEVADSHLSTDNIMRLPVEILVTITDSMKRDNPEQLIECTKVNSYWNRLFDERSTVNGLLRLLPNLCAYLTKNDLWRLRLVNSKISVTLSKMLDYALGNYGDGTDAENPPLPLRWRVIPTIVVTAETVGGDYHLRYHRLASLLGDIELMRRLQQDRRHNWCPISNSVLCKSMDVTLGFRSGRNTTRSAIAIMDLLREHGHLVCDLRLRVTDNSVRETGAVIQRLMRLFQNVRRLELFADVSTLDSRYMKVQYKISTRMPLNPDPQLHPPLTLPKLQHLLLRPRFVGPWMKAKWEISLQLSRAFGLIFHAQFQNIQSFITTDIKGAVFTFNQIYLKTRNISSLGIWLRRDWGRELCTASVMTVRRLTLRMTLQNYMAVNNRVKFKPLSLAHVLRLLALCRILKDSLEFLRFDFVLDGRQMPEYEVIRHGLFPAFPLGTLGTLPPVEFTRLSTVVIKNGFLAEGFGGFAGIPNLKVIRMEYDRFPLLEQVIGLAESGNEIWEHVPSLETFTVEGKVDGKWICRTREQWEFLAKQPATETVESNQK